MGFTYTETPRKNQGILIVDDMRMMRIVLSSIMKEAGITVLGEASNGLEALEMYPRLRPAIVTLDILMPGMDGFAVMEKLLKFDPTACIVICSSLQYKYHITKALHAGARDFLVKPFRPDLVQNLLFNLLQENATTSYEPIGGGWRRYQ